MADPLDLLRGARFLLAEDKPVNRQVAVNIPVRAGVPVDEAYDGLQVLESTTLGQYDLVPMASPVPRPASMNASASRSVSASCSR